MNSSAHCISCKKRAVIALLFGLLLSACASIGPRNQAEYKGYNYETSFRDVTDAKCKYGPYTWSGIIIWDGTVFKNLSCTWKSLDGTIRTESIDMQTLLTPKVVKWEFSDVEVYRDRPFQMNPDVRVELRDKLFRISIQARVSTLGGTTVNGGQYLPVRIVTNTLLEHIGQ